MCGRYTLFETKDLGPRFNLATKSPGFVSKDNYNVAPRQRLPIVYQKDDARNLELMQWGFLPAWSKDPAKDRRPINTRAESVFNSPMWRGAVSHYRCLVPARGFYEWQVTPTGHKTPYYIYPKDQKLFAFAGLYSVFKDVEDMALYSFSIITTTPNKEMAKVHDRMPVILLPDQETVWLGAEAGDQTTLAGLLGPYPDQMLNIYKVSEDVNSPRNNNRHLVDAVK
jgi:putative SOS response-associated peptidase YedK